MLSPMLLGYHFLSDIIVVKRWILRQKIRRSQSEMVAKASEPPKDKKMVSASSQLTFALFTTLSNLCVQFLTSEFLPIGKHPVKI